MTDSTPAPVDPWALLHATAREDGARAAELADALGVGTLAERTGTAFTLVTPQEVRATMAVAGNTQPAGLLHGGATAALAETVGSVGAVVAAEPGRLAVGVDLNATHHRAVRPEECATVSATGRPLHVGRRVVSYEVVVTDDRGRRVCTARLTCQLLAVPSVPSVPPEGPLRRR